MDFVLTILAGITAFTLVYKATPYRTAGEKKPFLALLPKYRKRIRFGCTTSELESRLASNGFTKSATKNDVTYYHRGSWLGDFSCNVKVMKVKLGIAELKDGMSDVTLEAGWVVAFDTGDFWSFLTELTRNLERKAPSEPASA